MKTIGLIGGMSWESSMTYYKIINEYVKNKLGGLNSSKCILYSVNFQEIEEYQASGNWEKSGEVLLKAAKSLEKAGADFIIICTNTMHKIAPYIKENINIPLLHIAEATYLELERANIKTVGLLGTKYTMEEDFYKSILEEKGIDVLIPNSEDRKIVNDIIYNELCLGKINDKSREKFKEIIEKFKLDNGEGVILGCTEIGLLIDENDTDLKVFDTTLIHGKITAEYSLKD